MQEEALLTDSFGRRHNYLRISLTDKCNFRCTYCMPSEHMKFMPENRLMKADEIASLAKIFVNLGVSRIRLTGGEPLLRKDFVEILKGLSALGVELSLTTNGLLLDEFKDQLKQYNLNNINVSIDSIDEERFYSITRRKTLNRVLQNIDLLQRDGFKVKLNAVLMRGENDKEILDMIRWSAEKNLSIRFIEFMPFFGNSWQYSKVITQKEVLAEIGKHYEVLRLESPKESTSNNYFIPELKSHFGIIPTVSNAFCKGCSRIRLTAEGKIKNCLFSTDEDDLLGAMRKGLNVENFIRENLLRKKKSAAGRVDFEDEAAKTEYAKNSSMVAIGG